MEQTADKLARAVRNALEPLEGLSLAVLFGSRARGRGGPLSDLDVAVLPLQSTPKPRWRLQGEVAVALADVQPGGRVDVVFLDEAPDLLRQRILETGRLLFAREPERWRELRVRTMREHGDREPYRRLLVEAQRRRLGGGTGENR